MIKSAVIALLSLAAATACPAATPQLSPPPANLVIRVDWQYPDFLPPRFRNHCGFENFSGRPYCSDHCGSNYQLFFCSEISFGCCRLGRGYCDFDGRLRCSP